MASPPLKKATYLAGACIFWAMARFADTAVDVILTFHEKYSSPEYEWQISTRHAPSYIFAAIVSILPFAALYLIHVVIFTRPLQRAIWASIGILVGLAISFAFDRPDYHTEKSNSITVPEIVMACLYAWTPGDDIARIIYLVHAGFGLAVMLSHTALGKRLDPALPQDDSDELYFNVDNNKKEDQDQVASVVSNRGSSTTLIAAYVMLWLVAVEFITNGDYASYASTPSADRTWRVAINLLAGRINIIATYLYTAYRYILATRTLVWNVFWVVMSGICAAIPLLRMERDAPWEPWFMNVAEVLLVTHTFNLVAFFSRRTALAYRFYGALGLEYPAEGLDEAISPSPVRLDEKVAGVDYQFHSDVKSKAGEAV